MATEKRLIDANAIVRVIKRERCENCNSYDGIKCRACDADDFMGILEDAPSVDAVEVPCKIGDFVWAIRSFKGHKHPQRGIVSDMYFIKGMKLQIVVKYVARGEWGKTVFATDKEAYAAIGERKEV